jgi:hypothetical protein
MPRILPHPKFPLIVRGESTSPPPRGHPPMRGTLEVESQKEPWDTAYTSCLGYTFDPHKMADKIDVLVYGLGA